VKGTEPPWLVSLPGSDASREARAGSPGVACVLSTLTQGQLEVALRASIIVASKTALFAGGGANQPIDPETPRRLFARLGVGRATGFWLDPDPWSARRALTLGLIDRVEEDPLRSCLEIIALWRQNSPALFALVALAESGTHLDPNSALKLERARFALAFGSDAPRLGARAFFLPRPGRELTGG
jgi:enoyl-CoA hydratase/carnithine racemase